MGRSGFIAQVGRKKGEPAVKGIPWYFLVDIAAEGAPRKQIKRGGFKTKGEAQDGLNELLGKLREGPYVVPSRQTMSEFLTDPATGWFAAIASSIRPSTMASYRRNLEQHVTPTLGSVPLRAIDAGALNALYAQLLSGGRRDSKEGGLSPRPCATSPRFFTERFATRSGGRGFRSIPRTLRILRHQRWSESRSRK